MGNVRSAMNNLLIPEEKSPKHVGYCLSCCLNYSPVYSIPLQVTPEKIKKALGRSIPISGEPLTKEQLKAVYAFVDGYIELCWNDDLEFFVNGMNLPDDWNDID